MESFTPSSLLQPKVEVNLCSKDNDDNFGSFQRIETQLIQTMEISEQQPLHSLKTEDIPCNQVEGHPVIDTPIFGRSSMAKTVPDAPTERRGLYKQLKHSERLRKYIKENGKVPVVFHKKDGHPVGKYASMFMTELGIAVKKFAPLQVSGWKKVTEEQKRPMFQQLESAFTVDFSLGPSSVKKETDMLMSKRYRDYRQTMHRHYKALAHLPWEERLKHAPKKFCKTEADWEFMCKMFESETFKKASVINSQNHTFFYRGGAKSLLQYKYDAYDGCGKDDIPDSHVTKNSEKDGQRETAESADNNKRTQLDDQYDEIQSHEEVTAAIRACNQVHSEYVARHRDDLQPTKSTSFDATSLIAANAELRNELHSTQAALQLTEDKVRILEANQKRLEEMIQANMHTMEANQRMLMLVFEKLASDIGKSLIQLPSSTPSPPQP